MPVWALKGKYDCQIVTGAGYRYAKANIPPVSSDRIHARTTGALLTFGCTTGVLLGHEGISKIVVYDRGILVPQSFKKYKNWDVTRGEN